MKAKILYAYYFSRAFINNALVEYRQHRSLKVRREWCAYKVGGGGVVPLGKVDQETAIAKATKLGNVSFVDSDHAVIFYGVNL